MKVNGKIMSLMDRESMYKIKILLIKVALSMGSIMGMVLWSTKMGINMKVSFKIAKNTEMVYIHGKMAIIMTDNGKMIVLKDMAPL